MTPCRVVEVYRRFKGMSVRWLLVRLSNAGDGGIHRSETSVNLYQTTRLCIREMSTILSHLRGKCQVSQGKSF